MTPAEEKIARALVACPKWRWLPGMLNEWGNRVLAVNPLVTRPAVVVYDFDASTRMRMRASAAPDITDPLTRLGVQEVVRLAFDADEVRIDRLVTTRRLRSANQADPSPYRVTYHCKVIRYGPVAESWLWEKITFTPLAALLAALEAAP